MHISIQKTVWLPSYLAAWPEAMDNGVATSLLRQVWKVLWVQINTSIKMTEDWQRKSTAPALTNRLHLDFTEKTFFWVRWPLQKAWDQDIGLNGGWHWSSEGPLPEYSLMWQNGKPKLSWHVNYLTALTEAKLKHVGVNSRLLHSLPVLRRSCQ